eukprot:960485-Amphidinium_carterae.1
MMEIHHDLRPPQEDHPKDRRAEARAVHQEEDEAIHEGEVIPVTRERREAGRDESLREEVASRE